MEFTVEATDLGVLEDLEHVGVELAFG